MRFRGRILECSSIQEFKKKKWVYEIEIVDEDENEDDRIGNGVLLLRHTKQAGNIKIGDLNEFEINIATKKNGDREFEFLVPNKTNWKKNLELIEKAIADNQKLKKEAGEHDAAGNGNYHICHFFLDKIKGENGRVNSDYKIKDNVILRKRYKAEFDAIWERQYQCNADFKKLVDNKNLLEEIVNYIFPDNPKGNRSDSRKNEYKVKAREKGLKHVIGDQIIYYQRKLKPQTDLIGGCQYETTKDGNNKPLHQVIERSHPLFQEFRMCDQINKCYVDARNPEGSKYKYSKRFLTSEEKQAAYDKLNGVKELTYEGWLKCLNLQTAGKGNDNKYLDWPKGLHKKEKFKGNETLKSIKDLLGAPLFAKAFGNHFTHYESIEYLDFYKTIFDSTGSNEMDIEDDRVQKIRKFLNKHTSATDIPSDTNLDTYLDNRSLQIAKFKFPRKYASLSDKAIKNLLPLMQGKKEQIPYPSEHKRKLELLTSIYNRFKYRIKDYTPEEENRIENEKISKAMLADFYQDYDVLGESLNKGGWPYWAAAGLMYGRHTAQQLERIKDYHDIQPLSKEETLRNPVVEQMVNETMQTIKSILKEYKLKPEELEIRVELARELKNNAKERESMHKGMLSNAKQNKIAAYEIMQLEYEDGKKKVKPENYCKKDGCIQSCYKSSVQKQPTANQILKYKLWKEQGMTSPYSGQPIPLCKLFDGSQYNKEHIIPKQRFFNDSVSNLVIAETAVNKKKDNLTAIEFIKQYGGKEVAGSPIKLLVKYEQDVYDHHTLGNRKKKCCS